MIVQHKHFIKGKLDYCQYRGHHIQREGDSSRPFKILGKHFLPFTDKRGTVRKFSTVVTAIHAIEKELRA